MLRPVGDVGAQDQLRVRIRLAQAVVQPPVYRTRRLSRSGTRGGRGRQSMSVGGGEHAAVQRRWRQWTGRPSGTRRQTGPRAGLEPSRLGKFRVVCRMEKAVVGGHVSRAEAGAAEAGLDDGAGWPAGPAMAPIFVSSRLTGTAGGVDVDSQKCAVADGVPPRRMSAASAMLSKSAAGAAGDDALIRPERRRPRILSVSGDVGLGIPAAARRPPPPAARMSAAVLQKLLDGPGVGGVEGQGDHGLDLGQVDLDVLVVVGARPPGAALGNSSGRWLSAVR